MLFQSSSVAFASSPLLSIFSSTSSPHLSRRRPQTRACLPSPLTAPIITFPITGGATVLLPGGSQEVSVPPGAQVDALASAAGLEPPIFAFATEDAWGSAADVGTLAVIDDMRISISGATVVCSGLGRWQRGADGFAEELLDEPAGEDEAEIAALEEEIWGLHAEMMKFLARMEGVNGGDAAALQKSIERMQALASGAGCGRVESAEGIERDIEARDGGGFLADGTSVKLIKHWLYLRADPGRRRELLSFMTLEFATKAFMDRMALLRCTDCRKRLEMAKAVIEPDVKELAAKAAIYNALG